LIYPGQKLTIPTTTAINSLENEVIRLTNAERTKRGLPALKANWQLSRCARYKSQDMINRNYFAHQSPTYGSPFDMIESFGIRMAAGGENIAMGQRTPKEVVTAWDEFTRSQGQYIKHILYRNRRRLCKNKSGSYYWTQMFIRRGDNISRSYLHTQFLPFDLALYNALSAALITSSAVLYFSFFSAAPILMVK
jgi:hypothetical protein